MDAAETLMLKKKAKPLVVEACTVLSVIFRPSTLKSPLYADIQTFDHDGVAAEWLWGTYFESSMIYM